MLKGLSLSSLPREKIAEGCDFLRPGAEVAIMKLLLECCVPFCTNRCSPVYSGGLLEDEFADTADRSGTLGDVFKCDSKWNQRE